MNADKPVKFTEFEVGILYAGAWLAREGCDTQAAELLGTIGVESTDDLRGRGLDRYDGTSLRQLFRRIR